MTADLVLVAQWLAEGVVIKPFRFPVRITNTVLLGSRNAFTSELS